MNELEIYVDSLDPSLSNEEKVRLVKEWKKANKWGENQVEVSEQVELDEVDLGAVKKKDGAPGAVAPSMGPQEAPQPAMEFGLEDTFSVLPKTETELPKLEKLTFEAYEKLPIEEKKKLSYGQRQKFFRERVKRKKEQAKTWEEKFSLNVTSPDIKDLSNEQYIDLTEKAQKELIKEKDLTKDYTISDAEIKTRASKIFQEKILPISYTDELTFVEKTFGVNPFTDFLGDIIRAGEQGLVQSDIIDPTFDLMNSKGDVSDEEILKYIEANKSIAERAKTSDEMRSFNEIYKQNGGGVLGFIKGVVENPTVVPAIFVSSMASQLGAVLKSEEVAAAAAAGAGVGAAAGSIIPGVGTATGAASGLFAGGAATMEAAMTFSELLQEEVGDDLSVSNIRGLLQDEDKVSNLMNKAAARGVTIGVIEGLTGGLAKGVGAKLAKKAISKPVVGAAVTSVEAVGGGVGEIGGRIAAGQEMDVAEIGFETIAGTTTAPVSTALALANINEKVTKLNIKKELKQTEFKKISQAFNPEFKTTSFEIKASQIPGSLQVINAEVDIDLRKGDITQEQADGIKLRAIEVQGATNQLKPLGISIENQPAIVDLMIEQKNLKNTIKQVDNASLTKAESARLSEIDTELGDLITKDKSEKIDVGAKKIAEEIGVGFEAFETQQDVDSAIATLQEEGGEIDAKNSDNYGTFVVLPDGRRIIILNKETATEDSSFTEGQHETAHAITYETVKNKPEAAIALGKALLNEIRTNKDINIKPGFQARLNQYIQDADVSQADTMEEVMTLVSDGLTDGTIEINETIGVKLGNFIRRALSAMGMKVKFKNGKDVLNFIKDYNRSVHRQQGLSRGLKKTAIEGAEVSMTPETVAETEVKESVTKESKRKLTPEQDKQAQDKVKEIQELQKESEALAEKYNKPFIKGAKQQRLEKELFSGDIKATIDSFVESRTKALYDPIPDSNKKNVTREQFRESMKSDIEAMVIGEFEAKQPLEKFITSRGYLRANSLAERLGVASAEEGITKSIDDTTKQIIGEETKAETVTADVAKKPTETTRFNEDLLTTEFKQNNDTSKEAIENKITKTITEAYKGRDITGFKDLGSPKFPIPKSVAQLYADMFGIKTVEGLTKKAQNFYPRDRDGLRNLQKFLIENSLSDYNRLPKTISDIGKATGIKQTKLGKIMYNDKGVKVGTAKQYIDIMRGKNITLTVQNGNQKGQPIEFNKPVKDISRSDLQQNLKTAWDFHVKNRALETLVPEQGKRIQAGAKFSKRIEKALSKEAELEEVKGIKANIQKIITDATLGNLSAFDLSTLESRQEAVRFMENEFFPKLFEVFGVDARVLLKSKELAPSGNNIISYKPGKRVQKIGGALGRDQLGITDVNRASKEIELNKELADAGLVYQVKNILKEFNSLDLKGKKSEAIETALKTQVTKDAESNLKTRELHKKGYKDFLNLFKKLYDSDPTMVRGIGFLMYNPGANFAFYRNLAQIIGAQVGVKKGREEHVYQAGNWARRTLEAMSSKDPKVWENWLDWSVENYYQEAIEGKDKGKESSEYVVDAIYKKDRYLKPSDRPSWMPKTSDITYERQSMEHPLLKSALDKAMRTGDFSKVPDPKIRYYNDYLSLNPNLLGNKGITDAKKYNVEVPNDFILNPEVYKYQGELIYGQILTEAGVLTESDAITKSKARQLLDNYLKTAKLKAEAAVVNNNLQPNNIKLEGENAKSSKRVVNELGTLDNALNQARRPDAPVKKIRVFDFDDTLAKSKSMVIVNMPDGSSRKINATEFASEATDLEAQGATFDFTEFSKVIQGKKGPLFSIAQKIAAARGTDDIFILTARPASAAGPIQEFMKANGIDLKLENIVGLGDGAAAAKGRWIASKAAEGYNDFYFADDAIKNIEAVKNVLSQVDVKSKVQQAKASKHKKFDKVFNDIIEAKTGIESYKQFSAAKAKTVGASKGKFTFFTTPSAEDFLGLLYKTLGKGKVGDAQMAFYKENLLDPFNRAEMAISQAKVAAGRDYKALKKQFKNIPKTLEKEIGISKYSYQHAIRTYIWDSQGVEVPGLSKRDQKRLTDFIKADPELQAFADQLVNIQKGKPYPKPDKDWTAGNITTDVISGINKVNRAEYLQEWQENVDIIFSEKNMNKLEAAFGAKYVEALKDSLRSMKSGSNRPLGGDRVSNNILDWLNNSVGAIMFLNTRSAVLQTISAVNFINWGDNNILKAGKAFANQKQFWGDFLTLMNSDYLLERRDGLKINVSESEIADAVEGSKNKVNAAISYLLNKGFVFTRYADSFAIASGGATFYRNRIESLVEQGMDRKLAEQQAFEDFRLIAEENQQSSSPMRISQQQRSLIGRIILQFGNTQLQYVRIQKRAVQDLVNGRGDWRANISKIVYYGAIQNLMFNALQSGLAWALFDDDEDDEELTEVNKEQKLERALNGAIDSQLKGLGIQGAVIAGVKNALITIAEQADKKSPKFEEALDDLLSIAPALGSKIRKLKSAARTVSWNRKEIKEKGFSVDNPAYLAGAQTISAVFNIPLDRAVMKMNNMRNILNPATENWQKVALALGWSGWDVGLPYFGLAEDKPVLTETEKQTQKLFELNKSDQVKMLLDLGLDKKQIRALTKEDDRVKEIIKLQNKKKENE